MRKISLTKRRLDRRTPKKGSFYLPCDTSSVDSNSDSGLDIGCPDSESRDEPSIDEPCFIFKNPSITSYENVMDKLLMPLWQARHVLADNCEPSSKKARVSLPRAQGKGRANQENHGFSVQPSQCTNYADLLMEEANLGNTEHENRHHLPHLQTALKTIFSRVEACNGTQDLTANQPKSDNTSRPPPQPLQANGVNNNTPRGVAALGGALSNPGRRLPAGRRQLTLCLNFPAKSKNGQVELRILAQPEEQHRARYLTEGSRGAVKDRVGSGYPTVKLFGYNKPVTLQVFIGTDQGKVQPHLFYQASKVCGKNSAPCAQKKIDGTVVLELTLLPEKDMMLSCDCIGILKERNVDVEQRVIHFGGTRNKKRSTRCRLVFRVLMAEEDGPPEILQVASAPIVCTQPPGVPEICRKSLCESPATGNMELFIIGKNFLKDTEVVFEDCSRDNLDDSSLTSNPDSWKKVVLPEKDFLQPNHLICTVPPYHDPEIRHPVRVRLLVQSSGKTSETQNFTYMPVQRVACPIPELAPMQSVIHQSSLGLVHSSQQARDHLPTLIQIPSSLQQHSKVVVPTPSALLKEEETSQQTLITTVVIPSSSESMLSPTTTARIIQDNQHAIQTIANSASNPSVLSRPTKANHIQVLVMPATTSIPITTTIPQSVTSSVLSNLKSEISRGIINTRFQESSEHGRPSTRRRYQGMNFQLEGSNDSFSRFPKEPQTIRELLMQGQAKPVSQIATRIDANARNPEPADQGLTFRHSLSNSLGSSLENIAIQSLIQTSESNADLRGTTVQYTQVGGLCSGNFVGNGNSSNSMESMTRIPNLNSIAQQVSDLNNISQQVSNLNNISQQVSNSNNMSQQVSNLDNMSQQISDLSNMSQQISDLSNMSQQVSDLNNMSQHISDLSNIPDLNNMSQQASNLNNMSQQISDLSNMSQQVNMAQQVSDLNMAQQVSERNMAQQVSELNNMARVAGLSNMAQQVSDLNNIAQKNIDNMFQLQSNGIKREETETPVTTTSFEMSVNSADLLNSTVSNIQNTPVCLPTEFIPTGNGMSISIAESQMMNFTQPFPVNILTTTSENNTPSTSLNFQDNFDTTLQKQSIQTSAEAMSTTSFTYQDSISIGKSIMNIADARTATSQNVTNSETSFGQLQTTSVGPLASITEQALSLDHNIQKKSMENNVVLTNSEAVVMQALNAMAQENNALQFQNINTELPSPPTNRNPMDFQMPNINMATENITSAAGRIQKNNFGSITQTTTSENAVQETYISQGVSTGTMSQELVTFTSASLNNNNLTSEKSMQDNFIVQSLTSQNVSPGTIQQELTFTSAPLNNNIAAEKNLQDNFMTQSLVSLCSTDGTFTVTTQNINLPTDVKEVYVASNNTIQHGIDNFLNQNLVNNVQKGMTAFVTNTQAQEAYNSQNLENIKNEQALGSFTNTTQSITLPIAVSAVESFSSGSLVINTSQEGIVTFSAPNQNGSMQSESLLQNVFNSPNPVSVSNTQDTTFTTTSSSQNFDISPETAVQDNYASRDVVNATQNEVVTFTTRSFDISPKTSVQDNFSLRDLGAINTTQNEVVTFTTRSMNLPVSLEAFSQQNVGAVSNVPESSLTFTATTQMATIPGKSISNSVQAPGPSMDQMSTMMSLLPESELLKLINPSTFDKM